MKDGYGMYDQCEVCNGDGTSCLDVASIYLENYIDCFEVDEEGQCNGSVDIMYDFQADVSGLQFDLFGVDPDPFSIFSEVGFKITNTILPAFDIMKAQKT